MHTVDIKITGQEHVKEKSRDLIGLRTKRLEGCFLMINGKMIPFFKIPFIIHHIAELNLYEASNQSALIGKKKFEVDYEKEKIKKVIRLYPHIHYKSDNEKVARIFRKKFIGKYH